MLGFQLTPEHDVHGSGLSARRRIADPDVVVHGGRIALVDRLKVEGRAGRRDRVSAADRGVVLDAQGLAGTRRRVATDLGRVLEQDVPVRAETAGDLDVVADVEGGEAHARVAAGEHRLAGRSRDPGQHTPAHAVGETRRDYLSLDQRLAVHVQRETSGDAHPVGGAVAELLGLLGTPAVRLERGNGKRAGRDVMHWNDSGCRRFIRYIAASTPALAAWSARLTSRSRCDWFCEASAARIETVARPQTRNRIASATGIAIPRSSPMAAPPDVEHSSHSGVDVATSRSDG